MTHITLIKDSNHVYIDGRMYVIDLSALPTGFHALQWYGQYGEIEMKDARGNMQQPIPISDISPYQPYIDQWNVLDAAYKKAVAEQAAQAAAALAAKGGSSRAIA